MAEMTPERIAAIRARAQQAAKGPWRAECDDDGNRMICAGESYDDDNDSPLCWAVGGEARPEFPAPTVDFIVHARQDIPDLLDALARAQQEIAGLEAQLAASVAPEELRQWKEEAARLTVERDEAQQIAQEYDVLLTRAKRGQS